MKLSAMDSNSVTIISLSLASHAFQRYRCDRTLKLGVKVESLKKIMDTASSHDSLVLMADGSVRAAGDNSFGQCGVEERSWTREGMEIEASFLNH